jgi:hypothetical protein
MNNNNDSKELLKQLVKETVLSEQRTPISITVNGKVMPFGCSNHLDNLKVTLKGLECIRDAYRMGSSTRHIYAMACQRLRSLIQTIEDKAQKQIPATEKILPSSTNK